MLKLWTAFESRLVAGWQHCLRWYSVQMHIIGTAVAGMLLLSDEMPAEVQALVPLKYRAAAIGLWFLGGLYARAARQGGSNAPPPGQ